MLEWAGWKIISAFLRRIPWQVWALAAVLALVGLYGHWRYNAGQAEVQARFDAYRAKVIAATAKAAKAAHVHQEHDKTEFARVAGQYEQEKHDAVAKERAVADAVRAGALRLRKHWQGCPVAGTGAAGSAAEPDGDADLRAADSGRLVRIGAKADAQVKGLQALLKAERERPIPP